MKHINFEELLELFDEEVHDRLCEMLARDGVDALVIFENHALDSSHLGERTAMAVGYGCTYKSVVDVENEHLGEVPSRFQYPVSYIEDTDVACNKCKHFDWEVEFGGDRKYYFCLRTAKSPLSSEHELCKYFEFCFSNKY